MHPRLQALALDLHRSGVSIRRISTDLGVTPYAVRKAVHSDFIQKNRQANAKWTKTKRDGKREYIRALARAQAKEEGVPYEEVYKRWGVPSRR